MFNVISTSSLYIEQFKYFIFVMISMFSVFEIIPIFFGFKSTIKQNILDFFRFQVLRGVFSISIGTCFVLFFIFFRINIGIINLYSLPIIIQVPIIYILAELVIYTFHLLSHKYKVPLLSKAHMFHHTITRDIQWTNSRKEHLFVLSLFSFVFCVLFYVIFSTSIISRLIVVIIYFFLNALSHFRILFSIPYLDKVFLFPKDHIIHHTERSGPYGVTLSIFDTIFNTRGK